VNARITRCLAAVLLLGLLVVASGCRAAGTPEPSPNKASSTELIESMKEFDGTEVTFRGEAIGEAMVRGDMAWIHINDDAYYAKNVEEGAELGGYNTGMAVWLPAESVEGIEYFGDYKHEGDIVEVEGVFNAACAEHGGDTDIHATVLEVVEAGHKVVDPISPGKVLWAVALALIALALYLVNRYWQNRSELHRR
jgi:hypothetical protein